MIFNNYGEYHQPEELTLNPYTWLIVFLGKQSYEEQIELKLDKAREICSVDDSIFKVYNIPTPEYEVYNAISQIDESGDFVEITSRFNRYVINKIKDKHSSMNQGANIAVVFDSQDFKNASVFKALIKGVQIARYIPICSVIASDYTLKTGECGGCNNLNCGDCRLAASPEHSCIKRLLCLLLDVDNVDQLAE
ncbi:MAG: hypothetical protein FWF78_09810 [Defluviitaleaceae bacterium]|nr:hypothetical protein [Defluviitaleaceae bacterium]